MSGVTPRKCGFRRDPPRLVLCYEKDGKARQRTMPVRSSSKRSITELVDELMTRHAGYLGTVPRQQLCQLVERLVQGPANTEARTDDSGGRTPSAAPRAQRNAGHDSSSEDDEDSGITKAASTQANKAAPTLSEPDANARSRAQTRTFTHSPPITGLSSSSEASLSDMPAQPAKSRTNTQAPSPTDHRSGDSSSNLSDGAGHEPTAKNPAARQAQAGAHTHAASVTGLSSSTSSSNSLSDGHVKSSDDESSLLPTATVASQPKKTPPRLDGDDDDDGELSEEFMVAGDDDDAEVEPPRRKPMVKFKSRDEIFEFSRDSSLDTLSLLASDMMSSSPRDDITATATATAATTATASPGSPVRQQLHDDLGTPLTSTPRKDAASVLGAMPPLLGLSPLSSMPPLGVDAKKKAAPGKKKAGKGKAGKAGKAVAGGGTKKKGKGKRNDMLLDLLDGDDEDGGDDALAPGTPSVGASQPDSEESGKETTVAAPTRHAGAAAGRRDPTPPPAARTDGKKAGAEASVPFLQRLKEKQQRGDGHAPLLSSSSDSEVDATGRFKSSAAVAKPAKLAVPADSPSPVRPEDLRDSFSSLDDDSLSFAAVQGAAVPTGKNMAVPAGKNVAVPAGKNVAVPLQQSSSELSLLSLPHADGGGGEGMADSGEDLNVVDEHVLVAKKKQMDKGFEANRVKPTDAGFQYDIEEDFGEVDGNDDCGWDENADEEDEEW